MCLLGDHCPDLELFFVCWKIFALIMIQTCPIYNVVLHFLCMLCLQDFIFLNIGSKVNKMSLFVCSFFLYMLYVLCVCQWTLVVLNK